MSKKKGGKGKRWKKKVKKAAPLLNPQKVLLCFQLARTGLELPGIWEVPIPRWPSFYSQKKLTMLTHLLFQTDLQTIWQFWFSVCSPPRNQTEDLLLNLRNRMLKTPLQKTMARHQIYAPDTAIMWAKWQLWTRFYKKTSMIINLTFVSHTYHHQIMHLSHVKIKENCIKTLANASPIDQSKTSFPRYFGCYEN